MSPAWIRPRTWKPSTRWPKGHRTYHVLYRRGGRGYKIENAGSFHTEKEAKVRRDLVAGWLAAGLDPRVKLAELAAAPTVTRTLADWFDAFTASRIDVSDATARNYTTRRPRIVETLGDRDPFTLTPADAREWIGANADLKPSSLQVYFQTFRLVLDHAGVDPNPFRDRSVKLPRREKPQIAPPDAAHVIAILERITAAYVLPLVTIEQTGMRIGETVQLAWGDVDVTGCRFRLRARTTKSSRARWVQLPEWLMAHIDAACPVEDRVEGRRVFPAIDEEGARRAMRRACTLAGIPSYSPHDLRHRRATLWHYAGVPLREVQDRIGHSSALVTLDSYTHAIELVEVPVESYEAALS